MLTDKVTIISKDTAFFIFIAASFFFLFGYCWFHSDPIMNPENFRYLPHLLGQDNLSLWAKIFDVCKMDDCFSRFRPLAHFFHWVDSQFIANLNPYIPYHFRSISFFFFGIATAFTFAAAFNRFSSEDNWAFCLMLGAFVITQITWLSGNTYFLRPGKIMTTWGVSYCFFVWACYSQLSLKNVTNKSRRGYYWFSLLLFFLLGLVDEQATFVIFFFFGLASNEFVFDRRKSAFLILTGMASLLQIISLKFIAPWTYHNYVSNKMDFSAFDITRFIVSLLKFLLSKLNLTDHQLNSIYQYFNVSSPISVNEIKNITEIAPMAMATLIDECLVFFGDAPYWGQGFMVLITILITVLFSFLLVKNRSNITFIKLIKAVIIFLYFIISIYLALLLMGISFAPAVSPGSVQNSYYTLPGSSLILGLFFIGLFKLNTFKSRNIKYASALILCMCVLSTLFIFLKSHNFSPYDQNISSTNNDYESIVVGKMALGFQPYDTEILNGFTSVWADCAKSFLFFYTHSVPNKALITLDPHSHIEIAKFQPCKSPQAEAQSHQKWLVLP